MMTEELQKEVVTFLMVLAYEDYTLEEIGKTEGAPVSVSEAAKKLLRKCPDKMVADAFLNHTQE